jgi:hypothetical protein
MSSSNHKRAASPSGDRDASLNKRQKREDDEKKDEKDEKQASSENQLDEKEEKKEREVKEDINAEALPVNDPDLAVGTVDKDLICAICFCFLTKPQSKFILSSFVPDLPVTQTYPSPAWQLKVSGIKMRCPNFKRGCKVEMLAGKEFQTIQSHLKVRSLVLLFCRFIFCSW